MRSSDWSSDVCSSDLRPPVRPGQLWLVEHQVHRRSDHAIVEQQAADHQRLLRHREEAHLRPEALQDEDHHHQPQRLLAEDAAEREVADHAHREREDRKSHTSELQSLMRISYAVFCLKKKNNKNTSTNIT